MKRDQYMLLCINLWFSATIAAFSPGQEVAPAAHWDQLITGPLKAVLTELGCSFSHSEHSYWTFRHFTVCLAAAHTHTNPMR